MLLFSKRVRLIANLGYTIITCDNDIQIEFAKFAPPTYIGQYLLDEKEDDRRLRTAVGIGWLR